MTRPPASSILLAGLVIASYVPNAAATLPPPASGLMVSAVTNSSFAVSWTASAPESRAIYKAGSAPTGPTDVTATLIAEGAFTTGNATNLSPSTRYFIAVYGKASGSATYSLSAATTSVITLDAQTIDANSRAGSGRTSNTSEGQLLFVDDPGATDVLKLFNGSTVLTVEPKGTGQLVDFDDFGVGSAAAAGHVIAVWRRDQDSGHLSVDGGTPVLINGVNPQNATQAMNLEGQGIADGCVFAVLQSFTATAQAVKNVYVVDPATGNAGSSLTGTAGVPGVSGRVRTSACKAAWTFNDGTTSLKLQYYDGSSVKTLDSAIGSGFFGSGPWISKGKIVYVKAVGGIDQVFLYDTTTSSPSPVQLTSYTDATKFIDSPQTDGRHVAWYRNNNTLTASEIDLGTGLQLASPTGTLSTEPEIQLNRGQLLWKDSAGNFRYETASSSSILPLPTTAFRPWLTDGYIAYGDSSAAGAFLFTGTPPVDAQQPAAPLVVRATAGSISVALSWDAILGASSYNIYYANQPGVTKANFATLNGGTRIAGITSSSTTVSGLVPNSAYYFVVTTVDPTGEGPESRQVSAVLLGTLTWTSVGGLTTTTVFTSTADKSNANVAYASGGTSTTHNTYKTIDGGSDWTQLAGGIQGVDVRALAADGLRVLATSPTGVIYRSMDAGANWTTLLSASGIGEQNQSITVDPAVPTTIIAADFQLPTFNGGLNDSYVIRSDDGGATWSHLPQINHTGGDVRAYAAAFDPTHTSTIFVGGTGTPNVAKSTVGGAGWTDVAIPTSGASNGSVYTLAVDPNDSQIIYAGVQASGATDTRGVWKSTNGGTTWTAMNGGLPAPTPVRQILIDPADSRILHLGTEVGYFYSTNGGVSWTAANSGLPASAQFINTLAMTGSHHLIAGTGAGLYLLNLNAACVAPAITGQPAGTSINQGQSATLSVSATGTSLLYQWYVGASGVTTNPVPGATSSSVTVGPGSTTTYWVQVSNGCGPANSNAATVTVTPTATTAKFYLLPAPCRILDTRGGGAIAANSVRNLVVVGLCSLPSGITAIATNVTAVSPTAEAYATLYPGPVGSPRPFASTINYTPGRTLANNANARVATDGSINIFNSGSAPLDLLIDVNGYFK